ACPTDRWRKPSRGSAIPGPTWTGSSRNSPISVNRHPGESRDPLIRFRAAEEWIPAFAGMTIESEMTDNPFFEAWDTPFELPPFARIVPEHFPPAFDRGIAEHTAEIAAIASSSEPPGFANTIEALERSGALLRRVGRVF